MLLFSRKIERERVWKGKTKTNQKMFHKNRKLAALEPRHLLPVWLLEMYWERPRNLFFHYARCCCCCRCQRCLPAAAACVLLGFGFGFDFDFGCGCGDSDGDFGNSASPVGNERVCVCVRACVVRVKRVCDEVENMLHVQPYELRSRLRQRICRRAALLLLLLYCNVMRNCCASFN